MEAQGKIATPAVKICGVRTPRDAARCLALGVDFVGFNLYPRSKRFITAKDAAAAWRDAAAGSTRTRPAAVFVDATPSEIAAALDAFPELAVVQLHGQESPHAANDLRNAHRRIVWKAVGVRATADVEGARAFSSACDLVLFDAPPTATDVGGTGQAFSWDLLKARDPRAAFGVAGGIRRENVAALRDVRPALIDVCSGVESSPGVKDHGMLAAFVDEVTRVFGART